MSTYNKITRHPHDGNYYVAKWIDDYFDHHVYGVKFEWDDVVYPVDMINKVQLKEFWAEDVIEAFTRVRPCNFEEDREVITFLQEVNNAYKRRWERDPVGGEGAVENAKLR